MKNSLLFKRNEGIISLRKRGVSFREIASRVGLSASRVADIYYRDCRAREQRARPYWPDVQPMHPLEVIFPFLSNDTKKFVSKIKDPLLTFEEVMTWSESDLRTEARALRKQIEALSNQRHSSSYAASFMSWAEANALNQRATEHEMRLEILTHTRLICPILKGVLQSILA